MKNHDILPDEVEEFDAIVHNARKNPDIPMEPAMPSVVKEMSSPRLACEWRWRTREGPRPASLQTPLVLEVAPQGRKGEVTSCRGTVQSDYTDGLLPSETCRTGRTQTNIHRQSGIARDFTDDTGCAVTEQGASASHNMGVY